MRSSNSSLAAICCLATLTFAASHQNSSLYDPVDHSIFQLSSDPELAFFLEDILSAANNGGANTGEVLRIATKIIAGNEESTYDAFYPFAQSIHALAESINPKVDPAGARQNFFHASTYYRAASQFLIGNQRDPRLISLWDQQIADFDKAIALLRPAPGERFNVRANQSSIGSYSIPGYFYKADADCNKKLPTVMVVSGYDGSQQELYHSACAQILLRGMNCATYEGPGQPSPRRYQNIGFIPDWWTATSPVVDYLLMRSDVDASKIVLVGDSYGGILAPRAVSKEPRISAVVALDGFVSLQQVLSSASELGPIIPYFKNNDTEKFNQIINDLASNTSSPISMRYVFQQGLYAFNTTSPFDWFTRLGQIAVTNETVRGVGARPVYIAKGEDDTQTKDQADLAYNMFVTGRPNGKNLTRFHEFLIKLGAGEHCSIGAETQVWTDIVDWLSAIWSGYHFANA